MFFCSFVLPCVTSSVSFTGFYTKDEPNKVFCNSYVLRINDMTFVKTSGNRGKTQSTTKEDPVVARRKTLA